MSRVQYGEAEELRCWKPSHSYRKPLRAISRANWMGNIFLQALHGDEFHPRHMMSHHNFKRRRKVGVVGLPFRGSSERAVKHYAALIAGGDSGLFCHTLTSSNNSIGNLQIIRNQRLTPRRWKLSALPPPFRTPPQRQTHNAIRTRAILPLGPNSPRNRRHTRNRPSNGHCARRSRSRHPPRPGNPSLSLPSPLKPFPFPP
jgi:hypothetical protein